MTNKAMENAVKAITGVSGKRVISRLRKRLIITCDYEDYLATIAKYKLAGTPYVRPTFINSAKQIEIYRYLNPDTVLFGDGFARLDEDIRNAILKVVEDRTKAYEVHLWNSI